MLAFSSDWTTLAGWRGLKTRLNSLRYIKGRVAKPDARHHPVHCTLSPTNQGTKYPTNCAVQWNLTHNITSPAEPTARLVLLRKAG